MKYYTKVNPVDGTFPIEYKESDIGERYKEAMKKLAELDNELELDRDGEDEEDEENRYCGSCKYEELHGSISPCDICIDKTGSSGWEPKSKPHHPYKAEPNVLEKIKHLNRRIGVLESRLGSKRSEDVPAYDESYWDSIRTQTQNTVLASQLEHHYQKTLERIKHDLKIGGGDDT